MFGSYLPRRLADPAEGSKLEQKTVHSLVEYILRESPMTDIAEHVFETHWL